MEKKNQPTTLDLPRDVLSFQGLQSGCKEIPSPQIYMQNVPEASELALQGLGKAGLEAQLC